MEGPDRAVLARMPPLEEERRLLEVEPGEFREAVARDADGQVRAQVDHQVAADRALGIGEGGECEPGALDRAGSNDDDPVRRHRDSALVCLDGDDAVAGGYETCDVAVRDQHKSTLDVVAVRLR